MWDRFKMILCNINQEKGLIKIFISKVCGYWIQLFVIMEKWINLVYRRVFIFSSVNKGTWILLCYCTISFTKFWCFHVLRKRKLVFSTKLKALITCLEASISLSQMTSSLDSSLSMLFSSIFTEKKGGKCYFWFNTIYFPLNIVRNHKI